MFLIQRKKTAINGLSSPPQTFDLNFGSNQGYDESFRLIGLLYYFKGDTPIKRLPF